MTDLWTARSNLPSLHHAGGALSAGALAGDHGNIAARQSGESLGQKSRIVLTVAIERCDDGTARKACARLQRRGLADQNF